ncbi:hypothetical protein SOHN41_03999 [Shewanella sp. HN-41]|nr:hypothetical protein SOHN41_03999 [Shewanella sp. HN-41]
MTIAQDDGGQLAYMFNMIVGWCALAQTLNILSRHSIAIRCK